MILKIGSRGKEVKTLQEFFNITADGIFGKGTDLTVKKWQMDNGLVSDGIVGPKTWDAMGLATTDNSEGISAVAVNDTPTKQTGRPKPSIGV